MCVCAFTMSLFMGKMLKTDTISSVMLSPVSIVNHLMKNKKDFNSGNTKLWKVSKIYWTLAVDKHCDNWFVNASSLTFIMHCFDFLKKSRVIEQAVLKMVGNNVPISRYCEIGTLGWEQPKR